MKGEKHLARELDFLPPTYAGSPVIVSLVLFFFFEWITSISRLY